MVEGPAGADRATGRVRYRPSRLGRQLVFGCSALFCLTPWGSPPVALALGIALALTHENPFQRVGKRMTKPLLQGSVVLLGFGMNLSVVLEAGRNGFLFAAGTIVLTLLLGAAVGHVLGIDRKTTALISSGTAICGGSAIAAVGSVIGAAEGEMTVAMGTTFLLNAVALYVFPLIGHFISLSQVQFGTWAGVAIHDISSVVGAASHYGQGALETATAVKLSRTLWIVPVAFAAAMTVGRPGAGAASDDAASPDLRPSRPGAGRSLQVPWFIGLFLLASLVRTFSSEVALAAPVLTRLATLGLTLTLFLIGAGISARTLRVVGWRPLLQGMALWFAISAGSLAVILATVR